MSEAAGNGSFALAEFVVVNAELQPSDAERYEAAIMHYLTEANAKISEQLAELRTSMDGLNEQLQARDRPVAQPQCNTPTAPEPLSLDLRAHRAGSPAARPVRRRAGPVANLRH